MKAQDEQPVSDERAPIAERWATRADDGSPEARAGALFRLTAQTEPLEAGRLAAIRTRLRGARRQPPRHWALRLAIAVGLVLSGGALTAAGQRYLHLFAAAPAPVEVRVPSPPHPRHARTSASVADPVPSPPAETPAPIALPPAPEPPRPRRTSPASPLEPADVTPPSFAGPEPRASALAEEARLLAEALRKLRQEEDPRGALALLDEHEARFAAGPLAPEAMLARIEALLRTHRNDDALALLNRATPTARGSGRELLVARAELRAAAGRCTTATADFDMLLQRDPALDSITERALWGRAACRATANDAESARSDLRDYLALFPEGRFAREARAALGK